LDLELLLGNFKPLTIDPLLDRIYLPTGMYALQFRSSEEIHQLRQSIKEQHGKFKVFADGGNMLLWNRSSTKRITRKTVRLSGISRQVNLENLQFWLEDYQLSPFVSETESTTTIGGEGGESGVNPGGSIQFLYENQGFKNFLIHCASIEEAQRLVADRASTELHFHKVLLLHYHA
jgi:hypothetical protein